MEQNTIINQVVNQAYNDLTGLVDLKITELGGYFGMIIHNNKFEELVQYAEEIINNLYTKFCNVLSESITDDDMEFIIYKSFCYNNPNETLVEDCFKIVNNDIKKQSSEKESTLLESLDSLKSKYSEEDISKSLDTIFDILLDYYSIIRIPKHWIYFFSITISISNSLAIVFKTSTP